MHIDILYSASQILFFSLFIIVWMVSYYVYRKTRPPVARPLRLLCLILRGTALSLILWLLFRPVIKIIRYHREKPCLAVLADASASMTVSDGQLPRSHEMSRFFGSDVFKRICENNTIEFYAFSEQSHPFSLNDSLSFQGSATNITRALDQVIQKERRLPLRGILLLSDGAHNEGAQPENRPDSWPVPIFSMGVGESREKADIILMQVNANEITYVDKEMPVRVSFRGPGFGDRGVTLNLKKEDQIVQRKRIQMPMGGLEASVTMYWTPKVPGYHRLRVSIDSLAGELTCKNNAREFYVQVRKQKQKVLLVAGHPDPDLGLFRRIIQSDEHLNLVVYTQKPDGRFYERNFNFSDIETSDVAVFLNFPNSKTPKESWQQFLDIFQNDRKALLIVAGHSVDVSALKQLPQKLPVHSFGKLALKWALPNLTMQGLQHPIPIIDDASQSQSAWSKLPPIVTSWPDAAAMPDAQVLVDGTFKDSSQQTCPLFIARSLHGQKSVMILANQLYRWHMLMWQNEDSGDLLYQVVLHCVRWLSTDDSIRPVRLKLRKHIYRAGTPVPLLVQVYDESLQPTDQAIVHVTAAGPDTLRALMRSEGNGQYQMQFTGLLSGEYQMIAEASLRGRLLGRDTTAVAVTDFQPEFLQTRARPEVLKQISERSGGLFVASDSMDTLAAAIRFPKETFETQQEIRPWKDPRFLILIVLLLSLEWWIRRRKGML